jgi:1,4-dihydroxy-2-naphthoate polyprenyltransferase
MVWQYLKMIRLHIVAGGFLAFTLGALLGLVNGGIFKLLHFFVFYAVIFFGDLSTHFSNDYFDRNQDRLSGTQTIFSGSKILVSNPNMVFTVRVISIGLLVISILSGGLAVSFGIAPVELLLIACGINFLGWFYSAPPLRFVSRGLGEVAIALAVGIGIPAVGYLAIKGQFDGWFALFALPFMLYGFMLALSLEAPDVQVDRLGDKKTLGSTKGIQAVFRLVFAVAFLAMLLFLVYALLFDVLAVDFWVVAAFATVPFVAGIASMIGVCRSKKVEVLSSFNVFSLFIFNVFMVVYLLFFA